MLRDIVESYGISRRDIASQTEADSTTVSDGAVILTLAESERLLARKHQELLQEFEGTLSSQGTHYEQQLRGLLMRLQEFEGMVLCQSCR